MESESICEKITELSLTIIADTGTKEEIQEATDLLSQNLDLASENDAFFSIQEDKMRTIFKNATTFKDESIIGIINRLKKTYKKSELIEMIKLLNITPQRKENIIQLTLGQDFSKYKSLFLRIFIIGILVILMFVILRPSNNFE